MVVVARHMTASCPLARQEQEVGGGTSDRTGAGRPLSGWHTARTLDHPRPPIGRPADHPSSLIGRPGRLRRLWILILGEVAAAELRLIPSLIPGRDKGAGWVVHHQWPAATKTTNCPTDSRLVTSASTCSGCSSRRFKVRPSA